MLILFVALAVSIWAISPDPSPKGLEVTSVGYGPFYGNLKSGTIIYAAGMLGEGTLTDLTSPAQLADFQGKTGYLTLRTDYGTQTILLDGNDTFNLTTEKIPGSNLKFGLDIQGGTRALLRPENLTNSTLDDIVSVLQTRIDVYGLRQTEFRKVEVGDEKLLMVSIAGGSPQEIEQLLSRRGDFKATIPLTIKDKGTFLLGKYTGGQNEEYTLKIKDETSITINGKTYETGDIFELNGIVFSVKNVTAKLSVIEGQVFTSKDIINVGIPPEASYLQRSGTGYRYQFGVVISESGSKRFAELTQNLNTIPGSDEGSLSEKIHLYLDEKEFDALGISASLKGKQVTNPVITGYGDTEESAKKSRDTLKAVLKSGDLPTKVEIVSIDRLNSTVGESYLRMILLAGLSAILVVSAAIFIRYRKFRISLGVIATMLCEVVIILGFAALTQWNLSSLALSGLIAAIGFGVDNQIFIVDETTKKKEKYTLREGLKRAYTMILGSGATTIFAMIPILFLGFGIFKEIGGFALTTIVGVLVGILITRPAFSKYVEYLHEKESA
ncbi:MAG: MMPL family transporter [Candidatus Aenigmarchaeota archaeon]|nr:MMPL family transporter [Candidatus Aenigmarchaeota archaeon]